MKSKPQPPDIASTSRSAGSAGKTVRAVQTIRLSKKQQDIVDRAFDCWLSRHFESDGTTDEGALQALLEALFEDNPLPEKRGLFLVPKRRND